MVVGCRHVLEVVGGRVWFITWKRSCANSSCSRDIVERGYVLDRSAARFRDGGLRGRVDVGSGPDLGGDI